jgi:hypothetical protein
MAAKCLQAALSVRVLGLRGETVVKSSSVVHSQCRKIMSPSNERVIRGSLLNLFV